MKKIFFLFGFMALLITLPYNRLSSQDKGMSNARESLRKVMKAYLNMSYYSADMIMTLYKDYSGKQMDEQMKSSIKYAKGKYFADVDSKMSILKNSSMSLLVDHDEKTIIITPAEKNILKRNMMYNLDSSVKSYSSIAEEQVSREVNKLVFKQKDGMYSTTELWYNSRTYLVEKMVLYLNRSLEENGKNNSRIDISYSNVSTTAPPKNVFAETIYIQKKAGKYIPSARYASYQLINNLN